MNGTGNGPVVEIRIHGVGGESASSLLDDPHPQLVAGDQISGFYVPGTSDPPPAFAGPRVPLDIPERSREALSWGGNTSGSWKNALWILLLPFALVNVAGYMHKPGGQPTRRMRWLSLTLTLSVVALAAATAYDLVAAQCGSSAMCVQRVSWLAPFSWQMRGEDIFLGHPTRRLGLVTLAPLGMLALLWFAGRYAYKDLESYLDRRLQGDSKGQGLTSRSFWNGYETSFRARLIHLAAGRTLIGGGLAWALLGYAPDNPLQEPATAIASAAAVVLGGCVAAGVLPAVYRNRPDGGLWLLLGLLQISSWAVLGAALGLSAAWSTGYGPVLGIAAGGLFGFAVARIALAARRVGRVVAGGEGGLDEPAKAPKRSSLPFTVLPLFAGLAAGVALLPAGPLPTRFELGQTPMFERLFAAPYQVAWTIAGIQFFLLILLLFGRFAPAQALRPDRCRQPAGPHWKPGDLKHPPLYGRGGAAFGVLAVFMILAVGAGVHRGVANLVALDPATRLLPEFAQYLDPGVPAVALNSVPGVGLAGEGPELIQVTIPWWYETAAHVLVLLIAGLLLAAVFFVRSLGTRPTDEQLQEVSDHVLGASGGPDALRELDDRNRLHKVFRAWAMTRELARADKKLFWATLGAAVLGLYLLLLQAPVGVERVDAIRIRLPGLFPGELTGRPLGFLSTFSLWLVGMLPVVAILGLRAAAQKEQWRRQIGRVWDVLMFWPRTIQPFAPPCYAERVIPQLRLHIDTLHRQGRRVVVAGHSQGSVIACVATAIGPLPEEVALLAPPPSSPFWRVDLVVYGSPIAVLYERYYPAYFGTGLFAAVRKEAFGWHHLFARTDVFAFPFWDSEPAGPGDPCPLCAVPNEQTLKPPGPVGECVVVDPEPWEWPSGEPPRPPIRGHSTYATGKHARFEEHLKQIARKAHELQ